jgi:hypothetical protein
MTKRAIYSWRIWYLEYDIKISTTDLILVRFFWLILTDSSRAWWDNCSWNHLQWHLNHIIWNNNEMRLTIKFIMGCIVVTMAAGTQKSFWRKLTLDHCNCWSWNVIRSSSISFDGVCGEQGRTEGNI